MTVKELKEELKKHEDNDIIIHYHDSEYGVELLGILNSSQQRIMEEHEMKFLEEFYRNNKL